KPGSIASTPRMMMRFPVAGFGREQPDTPTAATRANASLQIFFMPAAIFLQSTGELLPRTTAALSGPDLRYQDRGHSLSGLKKERREPIWDRRSGRRSRLKRLTGAPIYMNQNDLPLLKMMDIQAGWLGVRPPEVTAPDVDASDLLDLRIAEQPAQVLHTPGHTEGSICLHLPASKLLLAGDTLFAGSIGRTDLPGGDLKSILRSLKERLLPLPDETRVIPGHGGTTTIGQERETNPFLTNA